MSGHALEVLEFERVLERIARRASSEPGKDRVLALRPLLDPSEIERELARVGATIRFVEDEPSWGMPPVPSVGDVVSRLGVEGAVLDPPELYLLGVLLRSSRRLLAELSSREGRYAELATTIGLLVDRKPLEDTINRCVDADGEVLDTASKELKEIRGRLRGAQARIVKKLEAYLRTLPARYVVSDASITIREGRYVIPLRREGKREVGGIVHDESQTGSTIYVEPPEAIELMNQLRELERAEAREIRRILAELTERLAPDQSVLSGVLTALADFDSLHARARAALAWEGVVPHVVEADRAEIRIHQGRHPLLVEARDVDVVPFDLDLEADERCLVVSGPNTGGKTVLLKATGLIAALSQSGVVPPVGEGTMLPIFTSFFADIGDEQSIARSLSTYSAHLANLSEIVSGADQASLVLIDEMGTGTDPAEGAALARAVLEELVARGARTIASSHLGELKRLDTTDSGIVNASLEFDSERMRPTYRLIKGRPGRSYGLAIARRLGFSEPVLDRANTYRDDDEARMEELLARLERREQDAERLVHELDIERSRTARLREELEARERAVRDAEQSADRHAKDQARKLLLEARAEVDKAVRELKDSVERGGEVDEAVREARRRVEAAAERQREGRMPAMRAGSPVEVLSGERVKIRATGTGGLVREVRAGRALVEVGGIRLEVPLEDLEIASDEPSPSKTSGSAGGWSAPRDEAVRLEIDLRGLRVHEVEIELMRALDQAILEDLSELRIIHGKGTGALRKRVGEMLDNDARVRTVRAGGRGEGGTGVTVAGFGPTP